MGLGETVRWDSLERRLKRRTGILDKLEECLEASGGDRRRLDVEFAKQSASEVGDELRSGHGNHHEADGRVRGNVAGRCT